MEEVPYGLEHVNNPKKSCRCLVPTGNRAGEEELNHRSAGDDREGEVGKRGWAGEDPVVEVAFATIRDAEDHVEGLDLMGFLILEVGPKCALDLLDYRPRCFC